MPSRFSVAIVTGLTLCAFGQGSASAAGLFDFFFGQPQPSPPPSQQVQPYAPMPPFGAPNTDAPVRREYSGGGSVSFCVRLCDGRFFPVAKHGDLNAAEACNSFCPAAKTRVFSGSEIDHAVDKGGGHYSDLENAYVYRDKIVDGCTCNGKTPYGLARMDVKKDPTLRAGDIVATGDGLEVYKLTRRGVAEFTPVDRAKVSEETRLRLSQTRVSPQMNGESAIPAQAETTGAAPREESEPERPRHRRSQSR